MKLLEKLDYMIDLSDDAGMLDVIAELAEEIKAKLTPKFEIGDIVSFVDEFDDNTEYEIVHYVFDHIDEEFLYFLDEDYINTCQEEDLKLVRKGETPEVESIIDNSQPTITDDDTTLFETEYQKFTNTFKSGEKE